jgi:4-amino-4-deoxy-L-arabinose transferase-like glycosyltransferase
MKSYNQATMQTASEQTSQRRVCGLPLAAWGILLLTIALSLLWSHNKLLWVDEFLALYSDGVPTFRDVLNVQLHFPLGIEPPAFHFMTHASLALFGHNAFALRLPALLGFLLFQVCLYLFVERFAGSRAALIALALTLATSTVCRSLDARPYSMMMGLFALAMAAWQSATRAQDDGRPRLTALLLLWLAIALAMTTHYFGVLILVPLCGAELLRIVLRRRIDGAVATTLLLGAASIMMVLPFLPGTRIYRQHYYPALPVTKLLVLELYRGALFDNHSPLSHALQMLAIYAMALVIIVTLALRLRRSIQRDPPQEWLGLALLAALPLFGIALDLAATHTVLPRYVLPAAFAFAAGVGIASQPLVQKSRVFYALLTLLLGAGIYVNLWNTAKDHDRSAETIASCDPPAAVKAALQQDPTQRIYMQTFSQFTIFSYYAPDPVVRSRLTLLIDKQQFAYEGVDNVYLMTENLRHFAPFPVVPYEEFLQMPHPLLLYYTDTEDKDVWIDRDLTARGRSMHTFGPWMQGYLAQLDGK